MIDVIASEGAVPGSSKGYSPRNDITASTQRPYQTAYYTNGHRYPPMPIILRGFPVPRCPGRLRPGSFLHSEWWTSDARSQTWCDVWPVPPMNPGQPFHFHYPGNLWLHQDEHRWIFQEHPRNTQPLFLS